MIANGMVGGAPTEADVVDNPSNRFQLLAGLQLDVKEVLQAQVTLEDLCENRFLSLQRLLAFQVRPLGKFPYKCIVHMYCTSVLCNCVMQVYHTSAR